MKAPVQIADYRIKKLHFEITEDIDDFDKGSAAISLDVDYDVLSFKGDSSRYKIDLFVKISPPSDDELYMPYEIELILEGLFVFEEEREEKEKGYHLNISGPTMLYGAARNIIHQLTGETNYGSISIPAVQFSKIAEEKEKEEKDSENNNNKATDA